MNLDNHKSPLEKFVARATQLYSLPAVAVEVLQLTGCPQVDVAALKDCIERDPALVGKLLRTVNSSLFGVGRQVTDLNQAITLLGIKPLKLLVLGFSLPPKLLSGIERESLSRYWQHTLVKATAARDLASRYEGVDADDAFLIGLLQDIGMLALLKEMGQPYAEFLEQAQAEQADLIILELETLGFDHRLLSARMLQAWGLPETLWRPIAAATSFDSSGDRTSPLQSSVAMLATADGVAALITGQQPATLADVMQREDESDIAWWTAFAGRLQEQVEQLAGIFDVAISDEQFDEIILNAHGQLAIEAEDAAVALAGRTSVALPPEDGVLEQAVAAFGDAAKHVFDDSSVMQPWEASGATATSVCDEIEPGVLGSLTSAVTNCRRRRQPLSLLLLAVDDFDDIAFRCGAAAAAALAGKLCERLQEDLEPSGQALVSGDAQLAVLLKNVDRSHAVEIARRILDQARSGQLLSQRGRRCPMTFSIGVASVVLPAKNFPAVALHEAAQRCLFAVESGGGEGVKSIDIY